MIFPTKKLGEVCEIIMGQSPPSYTYNTNKKGLPFYQGKKDYGDKYPSPRVWCSEPTKIVEAGDILISVRAPVGALNVAEEKSCIGRGLTGLRAGKKLNQDFLFYFLKSKEKNIADLGTGSTFTAISRKHLENLEIPLPPIEIQKKIVERIEKMMVKIDEAKKLRKEALADASALIPSALNKIFEEGKRNGWEDVKVGDVCEKPQYGYTESAKLEAVGPKFLRITDIQNGNVDWKNVPYCFCNDIEKYQLKNGDIVFARTGATVGKSYLIKDSPKNAIFASYLIRLRATEKILPDFLYYFFQSPDYWRQITQGQVGGAQPNVNGTKLAKIKFPLPPLPEQNKIVKYLDSLSEKVRKIQSLQSASEKELKLLEKGDFEGGVLWYN